MEHEEHNQNRSFRLKRGINFRQSHPFGKLRSTDRARPAGRLREGGGDVPGAGHIRGWGGPPRVQRRDLECLFHLFPFLLRFICSTLSASPCLLLDHRQSATQSYVPPCLFYLACFTVSVFTLPVSPCLFHLVCLSRPSTIGNAIVIPGVAKEPPQLHVRKVGVRLVDTLPRHQWPGAIGINRFEC